MASKSVLDLFGKVIKAPHNGQPKLCMQLVKHLQLLNNESLDEQQQKEVFYVLTRLVRGLGSPKTQVRTVYYSVLAVIVSLLNDKSWFNLDNFKDIVDKELTKYDSKAEEGDILSGKVLCYGSMIRSGVFSAGSIDTQKAIVAELLNNMKKKSYLPLLTYKFLTEAIDSSSNVMFTEIIWPYLKKYIGVPITKQTLDSLYCIIQVHSQYPKLIDGAFIPRVLEIATELLCQESMNDIAKILILNISSMEVLEHPVYESFAIALTSVDNSNVLIKSFWAVLQPHFTGPHSRYQQMAVMKLFTYIVKTSSPDSVHLLLSNWFIDMLLKSFSRPNADTLVSYARLSISAVMDRISTFTTAEIAYRILLKFILPPGDMMVEKITGIKILQNCLLKMDEEHIKLLAKQCQLVILMKKKGNDEKGHFWKIQDRGYAAQLLARLLGLQNSNDIIWKIEQLKFMLEHAFYTNQSDKYYISNELAAIIKDSFLKALSHKQPNLETLRLTLSTLVNYSDELLKGDRQLRPKTSKEDMNNWKKMIKTTKDIEKKLKKCADKSKEQSILFVFHILFLQMGLYLFVEPSVAIETLEELQNCYEHHTINKDDEEKDEPNWVEVVVELMLSLLARESYLLRQLISRVFSHLCSEITPQASHQILQILNPEYDSGLNSIDDDSDDNSEIESDEDEAENSDAESKVNASKMNGHGLDNEDDEETDGSETDEQSSDGDQDNTEQLKLALHKAMMSANQHSDDESVDIDDMPEEEGKMIDDLLSEAFKSYKKNSIKNPKHIKEKINFRLRVMDLVDIYLDNNPSFCLIMDTIPTLFSLLEYCIKDNQQRPLETRVRSALKKISQIKKINNTDSVDDELIAMVLKVLMDKGVRTTPVFLDICSHITQCCTFLVKSYVHMISGMSLKKQNSPKVISILEDSITDFFTKRDCLLPVSLFESLLSKVSWKRNMHLIEIILPYAFNDSVRWFRRSQAICMLVSFYQNTRLLEQLKDDKQLDKIEKNLSEYIIKFFTSLDDSQPDVSGRQRYINELLNILYIICVNKFSRHCCDWGQLVKILENSTRRFNQAGRKNWNKLRQATQKINTANIQRINLDNNNSSKSPFGKTPVKRKSLIHSSKKVKKIKNI
ncbi:Armadillo-type fold,DNA polymerase V,Armadillo-like helical [Cinara cedri]|uniref:Armadillo-type fold,DNA polymerase V,Armadillo-like helical n=1 Tax=Cinara cedri TaxID=506608 RepID=A0A5E4M5Q1_9HEMI|nr:Armadillo-type fold,DNA polymerase V,Armadillo-like helical [Cinara cedri]